ncbi:MAG: type VI secretion system baseplate subunit TssK, partial [Candidatus Adiutrix sp.]|nr:type VI secretion system baseplate subunit TssK [Candidatus Adiutrix sp.]
MFASRPVFWHSGQFLDPQHFQQADSHHYQQRAASFADGRPWPWGVNGLEIDEGALASGLVKIVRADLTFPDGTRAVAEPRREDGNAVIESRELDDVWPDRREPLTLRVGLARPAARGNVAGVLCGEGLPSGPGRYVAAEADEMTADRYALPHPTLPEPSAPVRSLYYYLRLFSPEESRGRGDYFHFPLLRLVERGQGPQADAAWCPPLNAVAADARMLRVAAGFESRLAALTAHLAPGRPADLGAPNARAALLSAVAVTLADLRLTLARPNAQPWELFGLLSRGLAAMCAALKTEGDGPALSGALRFDHDAPLTSLAALEPHYTRLSNAVLPEIAAELPFARRGDLLVAALGSTVAEPGLEPLIRLKNNDSPAEMLAEGRLAAGSPEDVRDALSRAVPALPLKPVRAPAGLPGGSG